MHLMMPTVHFCPWSPFIWTSHTCPVPQPSFAHGFKWLFSCCAFKQQAFGHQYGGFHFYDESPNGYSFKDEDLGLATHESDFDQYDFYYNLEELQKPLKMDDDTISNMHSPSLQKCSYLQWDTPVQWDEEMSTDYTNLFAYASNLEAELDCTICHIQF
jgi:hypothetical protein